MDDINTDELVAQTIDDGFLSISAFVNIDHEGERLEVAGHFEIHDEADARRLAASIVAPWAPQVG
ncbi:hypothetical protein KK103_11870 [Curtobacterium flaccumfaciens pv. flaccumfaciens]|uniref:Uncharacterized protein n=1 Tax=Curtobacterium flaccumfaciens pv. flaccumfaciens TaxID=138532 RepID=A0A9Q2W324_9MICO|nr:hypothetical protein [Curtobacterium flaccumfaciens]MBT1542462.1 hypothetical protein [Curtobacterium flaccumfaciens pv. flaccumfaciens]